MNNQTELPFHIRQAVPADSEEIRRLIHFVRINPMGLDWRHFLVAVDANGRILGCGQVKIHRGDVRELASIAVWPEYRGMGLASELIRRLVDENPPPLYLMCRDVLGSFYERFGFSAIPEGDMPPYFRWMERAFKLAKVFRRTEGELLVMVWMEKISRDV